ncbi:MAG: CDP-alcohol phosphatidyltransferase family protein [Nocardioidaceae bacterium]|nr:CDP-alcohol phosphatidyltransferase family protein [Nocardioidaceae bacterium]
MPQVHSDPVHPDLPLLGLAALGQLALLGAVHAVAGLPAAGWAVALALQAAVLVLLRRGLGEAETERLGAANLVTLTRSVLTCGVAGLVAVPAAAASSPAAVVVALAAPALVLDAVDGRVARRTGNVTRLGARFDMETDALLILALSWAVVADVGAWVLLIGLARYLLWGAQRLLPALQGDVPVRQWRKAVAAVQGVVLVVVVSGLLPRPVSFAVLLAALGLLAASFLTEVSERCGLGAAASAGEAPHVGESVEPRAPSRWAPVVSGLLSALAVVVVWLALAAPNGDRHLSPLLVLRVPLELMALVVVAALVPSRWGRWLGLGFGVLAAVTLALKSMNVGFTLVLDRKFDIISDWFYLRSAVGVLADSVGDLAAGFLVVLLVVAVGALAVILPLATRRVCSVVRRHRAPAIGAAAVLTAASVGLTAAGVGPEPYHESLAIASGGLVVDEAVSVRSDLRDHAVFAREISTDPMAAIPSDRLLRGLAGKDVLLVFVESYGRSAIQDSSMAPGIAAVLADQGRALRRAGYRSRSAFLTSPTFGAASWLAHATLQSGLWVDSQRRYSQLMASERLTLDGAFHRAGWRTVVVAPAVTDGWPEGQRLYGFDRLYGTHDVGYEGPAFGYGPVPDQYTLAHLRRAELLPAPRQPVLAELDLVSSHHPWAPLPRMVAWDAVGDGSVYDGMPEQGDTAEEVLSDPDRVRAAYGRSIEYTLDALLSFLTTYPDPDLVVVMLGDHQPHHYVSGADPGYDVPISVIAQDPRVLTAIDEWGWSPGLRPPSDAPVAPMDTFRDRFLTAYSAPRAGPP